MGSEILGASDLTVRYGTAPALSRVTLSLAKGQVYALIGRSGAGKSSLIRCLLGQQKPTDGEARLFGAPVWTTRAAAMARVGVVPEQPDAPPEMTARQLSRFCSRLYASWDAAGVEARLSRFGIPVSIPIGRLPTEQQVLVQLALALGHGPELLVIDDPPLGLDSAARKVLLEDLAGELADRGTTVFLSAHDAAGVDGIADRVGILHGGKLALDEELEELKARFRVLRYANEATEERVERQTLGNELEAFHAVRVRVRGWGIEAVVANYDDLAFHRFAAAEGVVGAEAAAMSLEEIFLAVAGEPKGAGR